jgi:hypothetical protein
MTEMKKEIQQEQMLQSLLMVMMMMTRAPLTPSELQDDHLDRSKD